MNGNDEFVELADILAIETDKKSGAIKPEIIEETITAVKPETAMPEEGASKIAITDIASPEDIADNILNSVDALQSMIFTGVISLKNYLAFNEDDRKKLEQAIKKNEVDRTADETILIEKKLKKNASARKTIDGLNFTPDEFLKLKKSCVPMVKQRNIKVTPELAFTLSLTKLIFDRGIDIAMSE
jgi:hypothetical protein